MKAPGTAWERDDQPATMDDYQVMTGDNGGVHVNSGIPNHAFYRAAEALGGHAWDRAGLVWYETLRDPRLVPNASFRTFARLTLSASRRLYGRASEEEAAVRAAWRAVKVLR